MGLSRPKRTVLYLALEDDYARLQRRLSGMFGVECADNLYFATQAKTLNEGLDKAIRGIPERAYRRKADYH